MLIAFLLALAIKTYLAQAFFVDGASMNPGLVHGDRVLVEKASYAVGQPEPGDVVVFEKSVFGASSDLPWSEDTLNFFKELVGFPTGSEQDYIKRVVAVAGDEVRYDGDPLELVVDGQPVAEPYLDDDGNRLGSSVTEADCERLQMRAGTDGCLVPAGKVFVMGDNRGNSDDSRALGPIEVDKIIGRALVVIWPPDDLKTL